MTLRILRITATALATLIILTMVAVGCTAKHEEPQAETEKVETVQETAPETKGEETHEEETSIVAVAATEPDTNMAPEETETEVPTYSIEEAADYVLNAGLNGEARKEYLGDRYEEVQAYIDATYVPPVQSYAEDSYEAAYSYPSGSGVLTPDAGINYYYGVLETYYNLPMEEVVEWMHSLGYDYEYWVRDDGVKMFGPYVMVAADYGWMPKGSIVETSLGTGIVCDTGLGGWYWYDIAVAWGD